MVSCSLNASVSRRIELISNSNSNNDKIQQIGLYLILNQSSYLSTLSEVIDAQIIGNPDFNHDRLFIVSTIISGKHSTNKFKVIYLI